MQITFSDYNANAYGIRQRDIFNDYYVNVDGEEYNWQNEGKNFATFTVLWNGQYYTECKVRWQSQFRGWYEGTQTLAEHVEVLLPVGYDGFMLSYYDPDGRGAEFDDISGVIDYPNEYVLHFRFQ